MSLPQSNSEIPEGYVDGCTGFWDQIIDHDISHCCNAHDEAYWYAEDLGEKFAADLELGMCVIQTGGDILSIIVAACMLLGVTTVGTYFWFRKGKWIKNEKDQ